MTITTATLTGGITIRTMTPVEYQKIHQAEEDHRRHVQDLHQFIAFMTGQINGVDLSNLTPADTDRIIDAYIGRGE